MPFLVQLKTDLKSLKFGGDQYGSVPFAGGSGLPYVKTRMPGNPDSFGNTDPLWMTLMSGNLDFPIRGGELNYDLKQQTYTKSGLIDYIRIKKFLEDPTRGPAFIRKQVGLQLSNPKMETGAGSLFGTADVPGPIENTRTYNNGINTLEQVKYAGTGAHTIRHGLTTFNFAQKNYYDTVNQQRILGGNQGTAKNRLVLLTTTKMTADESENFKRFDDVIINANKINELGISLNRDILFEYLGGPQSVFGVGSTFIFRKEDTAKLIKTNVAVPEKIKNAYQLYAKRDTEGNSISGLSNRLLLLKYLKMANLLGRNAPVLNSQDQSSINDWNISEDPKELFNYPQGPGTFSRDQNGSIKSGVIRDNTSIPRFENTYDGLYGQNTKMPIALEGKYLRYGKPLQSNIAIGQTFTPVPNRLEVLRDLKILKTLSEDASVWGISTKNDFELFRYEKGPGEIMGLNSSGIDTNDLNLEVKTSKKETVIKRSVDTSNLKSLGGSAMTYASLFEQKINESLYSSTEVIEHSTSNFGKRKIQDFRSGSSVNSLDGKWTEAEGIDYRFYTSNKKDRINLLYPMIMENDKGPWAINGLDNSSTDDLIKFVFEAVSNESPGKSIALFFRAYLNGGITDNHGASWNGFKYLGRGEEFFTYQGFTRTLSFSFKVFAASSEELEPMYNRVHALASQVYPDYSPIGVMRAPVMRLTIGDYLHRMPGLLESVNITTENAGFEITDGKQLPMALNISVGFKPIPEKIPRRFNTALVPQLFANKVIADETRAALFNPASSNERIQKEEDKYAKDLAKRGALVEDREADPPSNQISSPTIEYPPNLNAGGGSRIELNNASNANAESAFNLFGASNYDKIPGGK